MPLTKERLLKLDVKLSAEKFFSENEINANTLKKFIVSRIEINRTAHFHGARGLAVCRSNSEIIDCVIRKLCEIFFKKKNSCKLCENFCVVALGGYGRSELCFKSDIDIMFLYDDSDMSDEIKNEAIDEIMYPLWDIGYKLGHSSRTISETLKLAEDDVLTRTALLDSRLIGGSSILYKKFLDRFKILKEKNYARHIDELLRLKFIRHKKYGWLPFVQEPNLKNGVGGLRDYHTLVWLCKLKLDVGGMGDVARQKIISLVEYKEIKLAYDFLLRCRNDLHCITNRPTDLLDLEMQTKVSLDLNFEGDGEIGRIENFMREVYVSMRDIDGITKTARKRMKIILPEDVAESMGIVPEDFSKQNEIDGFEIRKGFFDAQSKMAFKDNPTKLIKIFYYCQKFGVMPSDDLEILIRDNSYLIDDTVRNDEETKRLFARMLTKRGRVSAILQRMHFLRVLGKYIPEFDDIDCYVQHELYHRYTADVHTLNSMSELDKIFKSPTDESTYGEYHKAIADTRSPTLLYWGLLLHDIGKGEGIKGHAETGSIIAKRILKRFNFSEDEILDVEFLVRHHLDMVRFWQSNDIEDENAIERFSEIILDENRLRYLYVLTFCDAKATSDSLWNSYKQSLHTMLYQSTLRRMQKNEREIKELYDRKKEAALKDILDLEMRQVPDEEIHEHFKNLPRNYFLYCNHDSLVLHLRMIHKYKISEMLVKNSEPPPIIEWSDDPNGSSSTVNIVTTNRAGLFYKLAGAFTVANLNILSSKVLNRDDGISIDTFYVSGASGAVTNEKTKEIFAKHLYKFLLNEEEFVGARMGCGEGSSNINLINDGEKIILHIEARDRQGLLFAIGKVIYESGLSIIFARIGTENKWANDTFYLTSPEGVEDFPENSFLFKLKRIL